MTDADWSIIAGALMIVGAGALAVYFAPRFLPWTLVKPWVLDGDTLDECGFRPWFNVRYRLVNIDAPETGDQARCEAERKMGENAKWVAVRLVQAARRVTAYPIGRVDQYGRVIANIAVDGADLGEILIQRGLAHPWRGAREKWCGPAGSLIMLARTANAYWRCPQCNLQNRPRRR